VLGVRVAVIQAAPPPTPPQLLAPAITNGLFRFAISNGTAGASYLVHSTTNFSQPLSNWMIIAVSNNLPAGMIPFSVTVNTNEPQRFYLLQAQ
jgi:hypothetical protein